MPAAERIDISMTVNGNPVRLAVSPQARLIDVLREELELTGAKLGCGEGECGACSVLLDDRVINSCLVLAVECDDARVVTIEGLATGAELHPVQQAFVDHGAIQCGYCSPGMILAACALLAEHPSPTELDVRRALEGNLCRCTGYRKIIDAVLSVEIGGPIDD